MCKATYFGMKAALAAAMTSFVFCQSAGAEDGWSYGSPSQGQSSKGKTYTLGELLGPYEAAKGLYFNVGAGGQSLFWKPASLDAVSFETKGLKSYEYYGGLTYDSTPLLSYSYKAPFERTNKQLYMLAANKFKTEGVGKSDVLITPGTLVYMLGGGLKDNYLVQLLLSMQYNYSNTVFYGNAVAAKNFQYAGPGAFIVSVSSRIVGGTTLFPAGQDLSFRTEFEERSSSVMIYNYKKRSHALRVGTFSLNWRRPSANNRLSTINGLPVLYDTFYKVRGAELKWISTDMTSPGFNADIYVRLDNDPKINQFLPMYLGPDETLSYFAVQVGGCYNWYADPKKRAGLFLSLGGSLTGMSFTAEKKRPKDYDPAYDDGSYTRKIDAEMFYTVYANVGVRFSPGWPR